MIDWTKVKTEEVKLEEERLATLNSLTNSVQQLLDSKAKERNYDNILSLCTYATSVNPTFSAEGQAGVEWRDAVWAKCYQVLDEVNSGTREVPTKEELLSELPTFTWPNLKQKAEEAQASYIKALESAVDKHIRTVCADKGYDSENSPSKYMARPNSPWYAECIALGDWIDACWLKCHEVLNAVLAGDRPAPTSEELLAELPTAE